jgi:hypothetical protein
VIISGHSMNSVDRARHLGGRHFVRGKPHLRRSDLDQILRNSS